MGGQAQLLRRHRLGRAGRELRAVPVQGAPGRPVAIDGRLEWREWEAEGGGKRQAIDIIADAVQFLSSPRDDGGAPGNGFTARSDIPVDTNDFAAAPAGRSSAPADDDIPF